MNHKLFAVIIIFFVISVNSFSGEKDEMPPVKVGVILSGCGIKDGSEIFEAVLTIVSLEREGVETILMAPDIVQASTVNHLFPKEKSNEVRNTLIESARIARGKIVDLKTVNSRDLDALIITGGIGSVTTLSTFNANGVEGVVIPDVARLVNEMNRMKKPIGSMCLASMILAKELGSQKIQITIGKNHKTFGPQIATMGAVHVECDSRNIVVDKKNRIVTTPAVMGGYSNVAMSEGIGKMVNELVLMIKKQEK